MREINDDFKGFGCTTERTGLSSTEIMKNMSEGGVGGGYQEFGFGSINFELCAFSSKWSG